MLIWEAERDVCLDGTLKGISPCMYIFYLSHSVYMERFFPGRFSSRPGKAGSRFAQPGSTTASD